MVYLSALLLSLILLCLNFFLDSLTVWHKSVSVLNRSRGHTNISFSMNSRRPLTAITASVLSCFSNTGPTILKMLDSSSNWANSLCTPWFSCCCDSSFWRASTRPSSSKRLKQSAITIYKVEHNCEFELPVCICWNSSERAWSCFWASMTKVSGEVGEGKTDQRLSARQQPPFPLQLQLRSSTHIELVHSSPHTFIYPIPLPSS